MRTDHHPPELMVNTLSSVKGLLRALGNRWPDLIQATILMGCPFNELPRLPFQLGNFVSQVARFLTRLPKALGKLLRGIEKLSPT